MKTSLFHFLEDVLRDYPHLPHYIKLREEELRNPTPLEDDNVGGSKAKNRPARTELDIFITIEDDRRLNQLKKNKQAVENALDDSGKGTQNMIKEMYFHKHPRYSLTGWANKEHMSRSQAYRLRENFFDKLANELNIYLEGK